MASRQRTNMRASTNPSNVHTVRQSHDALMRVYQSSQTPQRRAASASHVTDHDLAVLQSHFQFLRDDAADLARGASDWRVRLSVRYYRKLFREYALADLSRYREGKVGLRWRTESEVVAGKGQFVCGNKACDAREELRSYELLFGYDEHGERKRCLVKVRVCEACARKVFYRKLKEREKEREREEKARRKRRRTQEVEEEERKEEAEQPCVDGESVAGKRRRRRAAEKEETGHARGDASVHALCAEINGADVRELHGVTSRRVKTKTNEDGGCDDEEDEQLKELLL